MIHDRAEAERLIAILETMPPDDWQGEFHRDLAEILRALLASLPAPAAPKKQRLWQCAICQELLEIGTNCLTHGPGPVQRVSPPAAPEEEKWQPIETAPEMRKIIVSYENALGKRRCVLACYYRAHSLEMHDDYAEVGDYDDATGENYAPAGWYEEHDSDNPLMPLSEQPTHWMPLPPAPRSRDER